MRIKKIEIVGFKSFKDKTVIHFDHGITGIVGPNGCGKSNIVDALVWVMGEMSAKHLRGSSMSDVIFAGADSYAPMGLAEVSLTLENDGGPFPAKYLKHSEVMVTRRLYRSGESEYLINKETSRLRDIQEIFMDTGAGSKGFSIVEQGTIGRIVTSKPEERRVLIEEAAGITKFKARKRESQRKLKATDQNLVRLQDIITELKRQLDSLNRQVARAERYKRLKDEIEDIELKVFYKKVRIFEEDLEVLSKKTHFSKEQFVSSESEIRKLEAQIAEYRSVMAEKDTLLQDKQNEAGRLINQVHQQEMEIRELEFGVEQAKQKSEMAGNYIEENLAKVSFLNKEIERVSTTLESVKKDSSELDEKLELTQNDYSLKTNEYSTLEADLASNRALIMDSSNLKTSLEHKIATFTELIKDLSLKKSNFSVTEQTLKIEFSQLKARRDQLFNNLDTLKQTRLEIGENLKELNESKLKLNKSSEEHLSKINSLSIEHNDVKSKLYGLEKLQSNFEGYHKGVKNIMDWEKKDHQEGDECRYSLFSELIEVDQKFDLALEGALGSRVQMLVTHKKENIIDAVSFLKKESKGRSSFFLGEMSVQAEATTEPSLSEVRAILSDVIEAKKEHKSSFKKLLNRVAVVDKLEDAFRLKSKYSNWSFVSLEGDFLSAEGVITAGAHEDIESGIIKRKREIEDLTRSEKELSGKLALSKEALKSVSEDLKKIEDEIELKRVSESEKEIEIAEFKKDLERAEYESNLAKEAVTKNFNENQEIFNAFNSKSDELTSCENQLVEVLQNFSNAESAIVNHQERYEVLKQELEDQRELLTSVQIRAAEKRQELEGLNREFEMLTSSLEDASSKLTQMSSETDVSAQVIDENRQKIEEARLSLEKSINLSESSSGIVSGLKDDYEVVAEQYRLTEASLHSIKQNLTDMQIKQNQAQLEFEQTKMQRDNIVEQVRDKYQLSVPDLLSKYTEIEEVSEEDEKKLDSLKEKASRIGEVNLSALDEHKELTERYEFLTNQQNDLEAAKVQLKKVIDKINKICTIRFKETFKAVNERFIKVFPVLFGGGEAELILVDNPEKDDLGIDIIAKPPGKKSQNVSLLSGGEKALTAVSLLFAIFLVKPSPYCLLDEVDAPLDDANVVRFNDLVKEMAKRSQIIVVTHNKYTMEVAKKLYGVTMEEKGVSKMVSVNLSEAKKVV